MVRFNSLAGICVDSLKLSGWNGVKVRLRASVTVSCCIVLSCLPPSQAYYRDITGVTEADRDKQVTLTWTAG